jgi:hypothetical protein
MSRENVEAVRELWALVGDDATELDLSIVDPGVVYEDDVLPDHAGEAYVGHEGLQRAWAGTIWRDRDGIAKRMVAAIDAERRRRGLA